MLHAPWQRQYGLHASKRRYLRTRTQASVACVRRDDGNMRLPQYVILTCER
jgi:hypothetical protein